MHRGRRAALAAAAFALALGACGDYNRVESSGTESTPAIDPDWEREGYAGLAIHPRS